MSYRMEQRQAERKRTSRRKAMVTALRWVLGVGLAGGVVWLVLESPVFALDAARIEVSGPADSTDAIAAVLEPHVGESLALLDVSGIADELEAIPTVQHVVIEKVWPAGLRVAVEPRLAVAAVPLAAGGFSVLDAEATVISTVEVAPAGLPVIQIPAGADERVLSGVLGALRSLPADIVSRVSTASAESEDSVAFQLVDGPLVEWGSADESALKAQVLGVMLADPVSSQAAVIDVSAPTLPITTSG